MRKTHYLIMLLAISISWCQQVWAEGGTLPLKLIGDHLLVPVTIKAPGFEKESHVLIDTSRDDYILLHPAVYLALADTLKSTEQMLFESGDFNLAAEFNDDSKVKVAAPGSTPMDDLTSRYDVELNNIDITAVFGMRLLKNFALNINIEDGRFAMMPSDASLTAQVKADSAVFLPQLKRNGNKAYIPLSAKGQPVGLMELNSAGYHSRITPALASQWDKTKDLDIGLGQKVAPLSGMVALRTQLWPGQPAEAASGAETIVAQTGLGLLQSYNLWLDFTAGYLALTPTSNNYRAEDEVFYQASESRNWEALAAYQQSYPTDRHQEEAAAEMFQLALEQGRSTMQVLQSFDSVLQQMQPRRKLEYLFGFCDSTSQKLPQAAYTEATIAVCEKGLDYVSYSQAPALRQMYQVILGERYLQKGDARMAWKYYLSASFNGDPDRETVTKIGLAKAYEGMGRYRRAYSTYLRLSEGWPAEIMQQSGVAEAMTRLKAKLDPQDPLLAGGR